MALERCAATSFPAITGVSNNTQAYDAPTSALNTASYTQSSDTTAATFVSAVSTIGRTNYLSGFTAKQAGTWSSCNLYYKYEVITDGDGGDTIWDSSASISYCTDWTGSTGTFTNWITTQAGGDPNGGALSSGVIAGSIALPANQNPATVCIKITVTGHAKTGTLGTYIFGSTATVNIYHGYIEGIYSSGPSVDSFTASKSTSTSGTAVTLNWSTSSTTSISSNFGQTATSGSVTVYPTSSTTYTITPYNGGTAGTSASVTITVYPAVTINSFTGGGNITSGQTANLSWNVSNASSISISPTVGTVSASGTTSVSPTVSTTYTLTAYNSAGDYWQATQTVYVYASPSIAYFYSSGDILYGSSGYLTPSFSNGTGIISNNIDSSTISVTSGGTYYITPTQDTSYTLTVTNGLGVSVTSSIYVAVIYYTSTSTETRPNAWVTSASPYYVGIPLDIYAQAVFSDLHEPSVYEYWNILNFSIDSVTDGITYYSPSSANTVTVNPTHSGITIYTINCSWTEYVEYYGGGANFYFQSGTYAVVVYAGIPASISSFTPSPAAGYISVGTPVTLTPIYSNSSSANIKILINGNLLGTLITTPTLYSGLVVSSYIRDLNPSGGTQSFVLEAYPGPVTSTITYNASSYAIYAPTASTYSITSGRTLQFTAGGTVGLYNPTLSWTTNDSNKATVSTGGLVTAGSTLGSVNIINNYSNLAGSFAGQRSITIIQSPTANSITASISNPSYGSTFTLTPSYTTDTGAGGYATITYSGGSVTCPSSGIATSAITANFSGTRRYTLTVYNSIGDYSSTYVDVTGQTVVLSEISPAAPLSVTVNHSLTFSATSTGGSTNNINWTANSGSAFYPAQPVASGTSVTWYAPSLTGGATITATSADNSGVFKTRSVTIVASASQPVVTPSATNVFINSTGNTASTPAQTGCTFEWALIYNGDYTATGLTGGQGTTSITWKAPSTTGTLSIWCTAVNSLGDRSTTSITTIYIQVAASGSITSNYMSPSKVPYGSTGATITPVLNNAASAFIGYSQGANDFYASTPSSGVPIPIQNVLGFTVTRTYWLRVFGPVPGDIHDYSITVTADTVSLTDISPASSTHTASTSIVFSSLASGGVLNTITWTAKAWKWNSSISDFTYQTVGSWSGTTWTAPTMFNLQDGLVDIKATSNDNTSVFKTATVQLEPAAIATSLVASSNTVTYGTTFTLTPYYSNGSATITYYDGGGTLRTISNPYNGSSTAAITVDWYGVKTFTLTVTTGATDPGGTAVATTSITSVSAPSITSFIASTTTPAYNSTFTLTGVFYNGTGSINNSVGAVSSTVSSGAITANWSGTRTYTLTVTNSATPAQSVTATVQVTPQTVVVGPISPANPRKTAGSVQTFTATISGAAHGIIWAAEDGSMVESTGVWTAPSYATSVVITAISADDYSKSSYTTVTVVPAATGSISASPSSITSGGSSTITPNFATGYYTATLDKTVYSGATTIASGTNLTSLTGYDTHALTDTTRYTLTITNNASPASTYSPYVDVTVVPIPTASLAASTLTPNRGATFTLTPTYTNNNGTPVIRYTDSNNIVQNINCPTQSPITLTADWTGARIYTLRVSNSLGTLATSSVTITPKTVSLGAITATGAYPSSTNPSISVNHSTTFTCAVTNGTNGVTWTASAGTINANTGYWTAPATVNSGVTITATSIDNPTIIATLSVPVVALPGVSYFIYSTIITNGTSATLSWLTTNATSVSISPTVGGGLAASGSITVSPTVTTVYTLTATNAAGDTYSPSPTVTITVIAPPNAGSLSISRNGIAGTNKSYYGAIITLTTSALDSGNTYSIVQIVDGIEVATKIDPVVGNTSYPIRAIGTAQYKIKAINAAGGVGYSTGVTNTVYGKSGLDTVAVDSNNVTYAISNWVSNYSYDGGSHLTLYARSDNANINPLLRSGTVDVYVPFTIRTKHWNYASIVINATFFQDIGHETSTRALIEKYVGSSWQNVGSFGMTGSDETYYISEQDAALGLRLHFIASAFAEPYVDGNPAPNDVNCSINVTKMQISATYAQLPPNGKKSATAS